MYRKKTKWIAKMLGAGMLYTVWINGGMFC